MDSTVSSASRPSRCPSATWSVSTPMSIGRIFRPSGKSVALARRLPLLLPSPLLLLALLLLCEMVADDAARRRAEHRMMPRKVSRHGAHRSALDAALCLHAVRCAEQQQ